MKKLDPEEVDRFLRESNAIEGVYDDDSLVQAHLAFDYLMEHDYISRDIIKHAHKILMKNQDIDKFDKGAWRRRPVSIGGQLKIDPPLIIDHKIKVWCEDTMRVDRNYDPVNLHVEFEEIHPFIDGNGRMGRLLLNWHLVKRNKAPLLIYTEADRVTYYRLFKSFRMMETQRVMDMILNDRNLGNL